MIALYIALAVLATILLTALIVTLVMFRGALGRLKNNAENTVDTDSLMPASIPNRNRIREAREWYKTQPRRTVSIKSHDGLTLYADILEAENAVATVLLMHGYRGTGASDFSIVLPFYHAHHINIVCPDQRACGRSEGSYITLGAKERLDCRAWLDFLNREFGETLPIIMDGVSMGATTVLMTAALDLPKNVRGIIADCGFTSPWEIVCYVLRSASKLPVFPFAYLARPIARLLAKFSLTEASATDAMEHCSVPVFFAHGKKDRFVPYEMSVKNHAACIADKEFFTVEEAEHGMCFLLEQEEYENRIVAFFEKCFGYENTESVGKTK